MHLRNGAALCDELWCATRNGDAVKIDQALFVGRKQYRTAIGRKYEVFDGKIRRFEKRSFRSRGLIVQVQILAIGLKSGAALRPDGQKLPIRGVGGLVISRRIRGNPFSVATAD